MPASPVSAGCLAGPLSASFILDRDIQHWQGVGGEKVESGVGCNVSFGELTFYGDKQPHLGLLTRLRTKHLCIGMICGAKAMG